MGLSPDTQTELVTAVAHDLVTQFAPEELPLFDDLLQEYFADPTPPVQGRAPADDPLGFGLGETLIAVSPAAAAMVGAAIQFVAFTLVPDLLKDQAKDVIKKRLAGLFNSKAPAALAPQQLSQVRDVAVQRALDFGLDPKQAALMADAMIGSLAISR